MMRPIILIALIIRAIEVFKLFDPDLPHDPGRSGDARPRSRSTSTGQANMNGRWGYASAVAISS